MSRSADTPETQRSPVTFVVLAVVIVVMVTLWQILRISLPDSLSSFNGPILRLTIDALWWVITGALAYTLGQESKQLCGDDSVKPRPTGKAIPAVFLGWLPLVALGWPLPQLVPVLFPALRDIGLSFMLLASARVCLAGLAFVMGYYPGPVLMIPKAVWAFLGEIDSSQLLTAVPNIVKTGIELART